MKFILFEILIYYILFVKCIDALENENGKLENGKLENENGKLENGKLENDKLEKENGILEKDNRDNKNGKLENENRANENDILEKENGISENGKLENDKLEKENGILENENGKIENVKLENENGILENDNRDNENGKLKPKTSDEINDHTQLENNDNNISLDKNNLGTNLSEIFNLSFSSEYVTIFEKESKVFINSIQNKLKENKKSSYNNEQVIQNIKEILHNYKDDLVKLTDLQNSDIQQVIEEEIEKEELQIFEIIQNLYESMESNLQNVIKDSLLNEEPIKKLLVVITEKSTQFDDQEKNITEDIKKAIYNKVTEVLDEYIIEIQELIRLCISDLNEIVSIIDNKSMLSLLQETINKYSNQLTQEVKTSEGKIKNKLGDLLKK
ncbi:hypothetical protein AAJ76_1300059626 [Vairimorpha ceranae]|uniref:Uncharacterized protein n=2 Tax=Vairimorpha ceranae TaxID=40302 RepID=A0A0F9WED4_9MICR|nr:hypothetical protein AAJ76_1300059626 [Vairimorpha ceranae]KAF5141750.1 hypothetical protein G9O61_00g000330 [Vairimorpha ceranae]KKO75751.1 hypothetical protein AAJ76_1300059626 [Vairimorpha ceranae]